MWSHLMRELRRRLRRDDTRRAPQLDAAAQAVLARGEAFFLAGDHGRAESVFREVLASEPRNALALHALGVIAQLAGDARGAAELFTAAIEQDPRNAAYHNNCGEAYRTLGDPERALLCYDTAIELAPGYPHPHANRGVVLNAYARYDEAIEAYETALALDPDAANAHVGLAVTLLVLGDYARGWKEYEWRRALRSHSDSAPQLKARPWMGETLPDATVLLYAEQGYGDAMQFVRYAPRVAQRCARVLIRGHAELDALFESLSGGKIGVVRSGAAVAPYDAHASLLDLPGLFETTASDIPAAVPYLAAPPDRVERWRRELGPRGARLRVGIAWAGSGRHTNDRNRSCTLERFARLAGIEGVDFYALQKQTHDLFEWPGDAVAPLVELGSRIGDFADTAAIIEDLDLVISVDTSVVHLAGALGRPVWTLLPFAPDWRWLTQRHDTPWYPTMRLFRQPRPGDWSAVFDDVAAALEVERSRSRA
jgi:tetratricopeptide (TPR) repeat protein